MKFDNQAQQDLFSRLPKAAKEAAYKLVRQQVGPTGYVSVAALMQAHKFLEA